jgi:hypothetical protein
VIQSHFLYRSPHRASLRARLTFWLGVSVKIVCLTCRRIWGCRLVWPAAYFSEQFHAASGFRCMLAAVPPPPTPLGPFLILLRKVGDKRGYCYSRGSYPRLSVLYGLRRSRDLLGSWFGMEPQKLTKSNRTPLNLSSAQRLPWLCETISSLYESKQITAANWLWGGSEYLQLFVPYEVQFGI